MNNRDLPDGFRMTELGPLPEEWEVVRLERVLEEVDRRAGTTASLGSLELPILSLTKNEGLILQTERFGKRIATENVAKYKVVRPGEIVYNPYVIWEGAIHSLKKYKAGLVSPVYIVFSVRCGISDPNFLDFWLRTPPAISAYNRFAAGAVNRRRSIRKKDFLRIQIPLPPLAEQRAIAHVLRSVQRAKEATERVIAAARELKKSLMRHLFTYGPVPLDQVDGMRLKETEIGPVPEEWEVVRLGEVAELVRNGLTQKQNKEGRGFMVTRIETIADETINPSKVGFIENVEPETVEEYKLKPGDLLFSHINSESQIGKCALYEGEPAELIHGMNLLLIRTRRDTCEPYYLSLLFNLYRLLGIFMRLSARAVGQASINQGKLKSLGIILPPLAEQRAIAQVLRAVDQKIAAEERRKAALDALFQTLLHHLMTGKVRVRGALTESEE